MFVYGSFNPSKSMNKYVMQEIFEKSPLFKQQGFIFAY